MPFSYDLAHWTTFLTAAVLLNLAPGPDMGYILGHTISRGRAAGFAAMLGIWVGALGHVVLAAVGLSAMVMASATAYSLVKYAGAAYLIWLAVQALRSHGSFAINASGNGAPARSLGRIFAQGVLIDLLNPKTALFFLAFLPQFVEPGGGSVPLQLILHGVLIIVVAALIEPVLVMLGDRLARALKANQRLGRWLDRSLGAMFLYLGVQLAVSDR